MLKAAMLKTGLSGFIMLIVYSGAVAHAAQPMNVGEFSCTNSLDDVYSLELTKGRVRVNNFTISEEKSWVAKNSLVLNLSASGSNRTEKNIYLTMEAVGYDKTDSVIFAVTAHPSFSTITAGKTEEIRGDIYVAPGTLTRTSRICLRVSGEF
jgi:hypothetical protein